MKTLLLLFCTIILVSPLFSQKDSSLLANQIKISPFRIIDFINPGYEISYERLYGKCYSTQLSLAYMMNTVWDIPFENVKGYRIGMEEKYFLRQEIKNRRYLSIDVVQYHVLFDEEVSGIKQSATDSSVFTEVNGKSFYRKNTITLNAKYGLQRYIGRHFVLDMSLGAGMRYFHVQVLSIPVDIFYEPVAKNFFPNIYDHASEPGSYITINIPFNVKIGYTF